jgi:hypothetical protein
MNDIGSKLRSGFLNITFRWTPRAGVAFYAGYYSLGFAYEKGVMAAIDRIAIPILLRAFGYAGIGAFMPTFQWYSALSVRLVAALAAGILYDLAERIVLFVWRLCFPLKNAQEMKLQEELKTKFRQEEAFRLSENKMIANA